MNLEYLVVDRRTFETHEEGALATFFGASVDSSSSYRVEIDTLATRLASVFATLREFPAIRFRAAAPPGEEFPPGLESRLLVAQRIAVELHERLSAMQRTGGRAGGGRRGRGGEGLQQQGCSGGRDAGIVWEALPLAEAGNARRPCVGRGGLRRRGRT